MRSRRRLDRRVNGHGRRLAAPLVVRELRKRHALGDRPAIDGLSLDVEAGCVIGLLGRNGAGKSTTVGCITGLLTPDGGVIEIKGRDITSATRSLWRRVGVAHQDLALYPDLTVAENLRFFGQLSGLDTSTLGSSITEVADLLGLVDHYGKRVRDLSGGQQRLVHVACAAVHRPSLLILDEPTAGLDVHARERVLDLVAHRQRAGSGVLYSSHYLQEVEELCDRVTIIDEGRVVTEGTISQLVARYGSACIEIDIRGETHVQEGLDVFTAVAGVSKLGPIDDVRVRKPSLESVFIDLTEPLQEIVA